MANKWIELNGKKEPPFDTKMIVIDKSGSWSQCWLKEKKETIAGKEYVFGREELDDIKDATHYMIPEPPKINQ
jgi:hypothetical protein